MAPEVRPYPQKDGALLAIGSLADKLKCTDPYKSALESMLVRQEPFCCIVTESMVHSLLGCVVTESIGTESIVTESIVHKASLRSRTLST